MEEMMEENGGNWRRSRKIEGKGKKKEMDAKVEDGGN